MRTAHSPYSTADSTADSATHSATDALQAHRERLVRDHMADENTLAFDKVLATFDHPHYEIVPTGQTHDGHAQVSAYYTRSRQLFPNQRNELMSLRHAEDAVIVEFWLKGQLAQYAHGPADRGAFACQMTTLFIFDGATLVCERVYFDALTMLKQLVGPFQWWRPGHWRQAWSVLRLLKQETGKTVSA